MLLYTYVEFSVHSATAGTMTQGPALMQWLYYFLAERKLDHQQ